MLNTAICLPNADWCGQVDDVICEGVPFDDCLYSLRRGYFEAVAVVVCLSL